MVVPLSGWIGHAATTGFAPIWWPFGQGLPFVPESETVAHLFAGIHEVFTKVLLGAYGEQHAVLASTLVLQARALLALGDADNAEPLLAHALGIQRALADDAAAQATAAWLDKLRASRS